MSNIVLLTPKEEFLEFLNPDYCNCVEVIEPDGIPRVEITYFTEDMLRANEIFQQGNKLYVQGDKNLDTRLYVINTEIEKDLYKENSVTFTAEDVIVELNYAPLFKQTDLTTSNRFELHTANGELNVTVDYNALNFWFGHYYDIGVVQSASTTLANRVAPRGTMSLMELLRFIEEKTGNVFIARYEKDPRSNKIFRYLDFINPNDENTSYNYIQEFLIPEEYTYDADTEDTPDTEVTFPIVPSYFPNIDNLVLRFTKDEKIITINNQKLSFKARDIGFSEEKSVNRLQITYNPNGLIITVNNVTFTPDGTYTEENPNGTYSIEQGEETINMISLPNHTIIELYDTVEDETLIYHELNPYLGDVHPQVLDLGFNVENITIETDETEAYTSISPVINLDSKEYTFQQINNIINAWYNLEVEKGTLVPMFVERTKLSTHPTTGDPTNYYNRPQNPQDDTDNNQFDYFVASAYWYAPFSKRAKTLEVCDESANDLKYSKIFHKTDHLGTDLKHCDSRTGLTETTTDEDPYNIFNQVCNYLKEHSQPKVNIKTDVAELNKYGEYNNLKRYDKVYIKIPNYDHLITARVMGTSKNSKNISENTIELDNYTINPSIPLVTTMILGDNLEYEYPESDSLTLTLEDANENPLSGELLSIVVYNNNVPLGQANNVFTDNNGQVKITYRNDPGEYTIQVYYPGSDYYEPTTSTYKMSVGGTKEDPSLNTSTANNTNNTTSAKKCWSKYGRSPNKKYLRTIGKPDHSKDKGGKNTFYSTVLKNKCPYCGHKTLAYGLFFGKKESSTSGKHPYDKKNHTHANKGLIVCKHCKKTFSSQGYGHSSKVKRIEVVKNPSKSKKTTAKKLVNGKLPYKLKIKKNKKKKTTKKKEETPTTLKSHSKYIKELAAKIVGKKTKLDALKAICKWMDDYVPYVYGLGFNRSPETVAKHGGNCCSQAQLFLDLCDAAGLGEWFRFKYVHVCCGSYNGKRVGHVYTEVITKSTGKSRYVDPASSHPCYNYCIRKYGSPYSAGGSTYPAKPF